MTSTLSIAGDGSGEAMDSSEVQSIEQAPALRGGPLAGVAFAFAGFRFDPETGLSWQERRVPLAPTEHRALASLLAARGRIVGKDELARRVWNGAPTSDNSISRAICAIRRALRTRSAERIVETIYGCGFRIDVPVEIVPVDTAGAGLGDSNAHVGAEVTELWDTARVGSREQPEILRGGVYPIAVARLLTARELLRAGRAADVSYAVAEVERVLRLLTGDEWLGAEGESAA
jgi:DNA-binding winged helix-turn-helix (wHTH) protein